MRCRGPGRPKRSSEAILEDMPKITLMARRPFAISVGFLVSFAGPEEVSTLKPKSPLEPRVRGT
eukprot:15347288-Heterocapsa_arctica.AAC.1